MARRGRTQFLDDDDPDTSEGSNSGSEGDDHGLGSSSATAGFKKRKRGRTKEDAIYGVFADSDEDNEARGGAGRTVRGTDRKGRKINYRAGQLFVPSTGIASRGPSDAEADLAKATAEIGHDDDDGDSDSQPSSSDASDSESLSESERLARQPAPVEDHLEARPSFAGLGSRGVPTQMENVIKEEKESGEFRPASFVSSRAGIGSKPAQASTTPTVGPGSRAGIGGAGASSSASRPARAGIGAFPSFVSSKANSSEGEPTSTEATSSQYPIFAQSSMIDAGMPTEFKESRPAVAPSKAFQRKEKPSFLPAAGSPAAATSIKFGTGSGGKFDPSAYLAKMGWTGGGLGKQGEGIVNPIEVQLRPERAGIAFGGRKEKTKQAKEEARRRGEAVSSDEEDRNRRQRDQERRGQREKNKKDKAAASEAQAWTKAEKKPRKPKVVHRTYEQIIEEAGGVPSHDPGVGQVFDASGREVSSLAAALSTQGIPTADTSKLPELRHNLRLICDNNLQALTVLAKEGANIFERRKWLRREAEESKRRRDKEVAEVSRLKAILSTVKELEALGTRHVSEGDDLGVFSTTIERLIRDFGDEIDRDGLDEAVVGALTPMLRRLWIEWKPLEQADLGAAHLRSWKAALRLRDASEPELAVDRYGSRDRPSKTATTARSKDVMTPYESLLWNVWMPKIRSALNNEWKVHRPSPAVTLLETWKPILPRFVLDNVMDQLLLPKLKAAVHDWDPKRSKVGLHHILFPWLPLFGDRLDETLSDAKRRIRSHLKLWKPSDGVPSDLARWRDVYKPHDFDALLLSTVVPKLSSSLRRDFTVDPSAQDMSVLESVVGWQALLRPAVLGRILEVEFFPKWLDVLHLWLVQRDANLEEVAAWYSFWKAWFPAALLGIPGVANGFSRGLKLLNVAMEMGPDRTALPKPETAPISRSHPAARPTAGTPTTAPTRPPTDAETITFRQIVEEAAAARDLLLLPLNRLEPNSGESLLRISRSVDGKRGATLYLAEDVVWLEQRKEGSAALEYRPVSVESLVERAEKA